MDDGGRPHLWGRERRYMLTELLWERGPMTVAELARTLAADGWQVGGRPSKTISDALRWEIAHGRVVRLGRGLYGPGRMPKQTKSWIRCRNRRTRLEAREALAGARQAAPWQGPTTQRTWSRPAGAVAHPPRGSSSETAAPAGYSVPLLPTSAPPSDGFPSQAPPEPTTPEGSAPTPGWSDDDVVVHGGGWSEADDAAEDAAERARLLSLLTRSDPSERSGSTPRRSGA